MAKSVITAVAAETTMTEGGVAQAQFAISPVLVAASEVALSVTGYSGASQGTDFGALMYSTDGVTFQAVVGGVAMLPAGATNLWLQVPTTLDADVEVGQKVGFFVEQTSSGSSLTGSWWVESFVNIADPVKSTITALVAEATVTEGAMAQAQFAISPVLAAASEVAISVDGWSDATQGEDFGALMYSTDGVTFQAVVGGVAMLPAGSTNLWLQVQTSTDAVAETGEKVGFVVAQVSSSSSLTNSWYVESVVNIADPAPVVLVKSTITALVAESTVTEGAMAQAQFAISPVLAEDSAVELSVSGWGGATQGEDFGALMYSTDGVNFQAVVGGVALLSAGSTNLWLQVQTSTDTGVEAYEKVGFFVTQASSQSALENSWNVESVVNIADPVPEVPVPLVQSTITAIAATGTVLEGAMAQAQFAISPALAADAQVQLSLSGGYGAVQGEDYSGLMYSTDGVTYQAVVDGLAVLPAGSSNLWLQVQTNADANVESSEAIQFIVAQTDASANVLDDSFNVTTILDITDTSPVPLVQSTITAIAATGTVLEGAMAQAQFAISPALAADAQVELSLSGYGASQGEDFTGLMYSTDGVTYQAVVNGLAVLPAGSSNLWLQVQTNADTKIESSEQIKFVVAQTDESGNVFDESWYVTTIVDVTDTSPLKSTITAIAETGTVLEGEMAQAQFAISPVLGSDSKVELSVTGWGAKKDKDFSDLMYSTDGVTFQAVVDGFAILPAGSSNLWLQVQTTTDTKIEHAEALSFVVAQSEFDSGFENSWYVHTVVGITDTSPLPETPSVMHVVAQTTSVIEGGFATSKFVLDKAQRTVTKVEVEVSGWSADIDQDTSGLLQYRVGTGSWANVKNGIVDIKAGATSLELRIKTVNDLKSESPEVISFVVKSMDSNLTESYYMSSQSTVSDKVTATMTAVAQATPVIEGGFATSNFVLDKALETATKVQVEVSGWGAEIGKDTSGLLQYRVGAGDWTNVKNGNVEIKAGETSLELRIKTVNDKTTEVPEVIVFTVKSTDSNLTSMSNMTSEVTVIDQESSVLTAVEQTAPVIEGDFAIGKFVMDKVQETATKVQVEVSGLNADMGYDTSGLLQYRVGAGGWSNVKNGSVDIKAGETSLELRIKTVNDLTTESPEAIVFTVKSADSNLKDSSLVTSQVSVVDQVATAHTGTTAMEAFTGVAAKQDVFDLSMGGSVGVKGGFDTIKSFGVGDLVKLPNAVNTLNIKTISGDDFVPGTAKATEASILNAWQVHNGEQFDNGAGGVIKVVLGTNFYLLADSNGNGIYDTGVGSMTPDLFVKVIGTVSTTLVDSATLAV